MSRSLLKELAIDIRRINIANKWKVWQQYDFVNEPYKFGTVIALIHSEASEALEWYREMDKIDYSSTELLENIKEEMADIIIRVLDWWSAYDDDPLTTILAKLEKNKERGERHGNKKI